MRAGSFRAAADGGDPRPAGAGPMLDPKVRAHLITTLILVLVIALIAVVWAKPILLLWIVLGVVAIMAYAAVYLLVSARLVEEESIDEEAARPGGGPSEGGPPEATPTEPPLDDDEA